MVERKVQFFPRLLFLLLLWGEGRGAVYRSAVVQVNKMLEYKLKLQSFMLRTPSPAPSRPGRDQILRR